MNTWDKLSMAEKADIMKIAIQGGVYDLDAIRDGYNEFANGGRIHIKPSHRGRLTELKARTGKTEADAAKGLDAAYTPLLSWIAPNPFRIVEKAQDKDIAGTALETAKLLPVLKPFATVEAATAVATPGSVFWTNPITKQVAASTLGGEAVNLATNVFTPYNSWGEGVSDLVNQATGWNPQDSWLGSVIADMTNPGYLTPYRAVAKTVSPLSEVQQKRVVETAMRSGSNPAPFGDVLRGTGRMLRNRDGGYDRLYRIAKYINSGETNGMPKGYYNSFADLSSGYYGGFDEPIRGDMIGKDDIIDAFLYNRDISPKFGLVKTSIGEDFGIHAKYIADNYADKASNIPVYTTRNPKFIPEEGYTPESFTEHGAEGGYYHRSQDGWTPDVAGHRQILSGDESTIMAQDIWKFNPRDYLFKWHTYNPIKVLGLGWVNEIGTPVITKTPWFNLQKNNLNISKVKANFKD